MNPPVESSGGPADEEAARAGVYGMLAALFFAPPDRAMLAALRAASPARSDAADGELETSWLALLDAARTLEPQQIADEFDALFGGVGKPDVYLFGSHYLSGFLNEKPLASLRGEFARLGIARSDNVHETEDHFACLCDAMRHLIEEADGSDAAALQSQAGLFARHIAPWADAMCDAVAQHPSARFYCRAARFARAFVSVERQAFEMLEAQGGA